MTASRLALLAALLAAPAAGRPLTQKEAQARAARVSGVRYDLDFRVGEGGTDFEGRAVVEFRLADAAEPLSLDFSGGRVLSLAVNGRRAEPAHDGSSLALPASALRKGRNRVEISFSHPYSATGSGLYRMKDPGDGLTYLYSDFEPYDSNQMFPGFDQPDLKAVFRLTVDAPEGWEVVSAARERRRVALPGGRRRWEFPDSPRISTYLISLHAGPYAVWKATGPAGVPLRLFARRSLAGHVRPEEWFDATRRGLEFYPRYFGTPYPFGKLDQLIVPDFNAGAMENAAAVTFSERFVHRSTETWKQRQDRASVILHEMAHQWFGDLVTMRWWDDLWLNESFATYMAFLALVEATEFKDAWVEFAVGRKQRALREDQLATTHAVESEAPDTAQAFANFDDITYGKGAASLKQLSALLGPGTFRAGVALYLGRHAWGNATRADFIAAQEEASGRDLQAWTRDWLRTPGANTLRAETACRDGALERFELVQGAAVPAHPALREHRTRVALYAAGEGGDLRLAAAADADYRGERTAVPALVGKPCPDLLLLNQDDHDFVKTGLDARGLAAAREGLSSIESAMDRAYVWSALWAMVRDGGLGAKDYVAIALRHLPAESGFIARGEALQSLLGGPLADRLSSPGINLPSAVQYLEGAGEGFGVRLAAELERFLWTQLERAEPGSGTRRQWFDAYVRAARTPEGLARLSALLDAAPGAGALDLDQDRRWEAIAQLNRFAAPDSRERAVIEAARDASRRGQIWTIRAAALRPEWEAKEAALALILDPARTLEERRAAIRAVFPHEQEALERRFMPSFHERLAKAAATEPEEFLAAFAEGLAPVSCRAEDAAALEERLASSPDLSPVPRKALRNAAEEARLCARVRAQAAKEPDPWPRRL